jgi:hypothetical protein
MYHSEGLKERAETGDVRNCIKQLRDSFFRFGGLAVLAMVF